MLSEITDDYVGEPDDIWLTQAISAGSSETGLDPFALMSSVSPVDTCGVLKDSLI